MTILGITTITPLVAGSPGSAPSIFSAYCLDANAVITASGYLYDATTTVALNPNNALSLNTKLKSLDWVLMNFPESSTPTNQLYKVSTSGSGATLKLTLTASTGITASSLLVANNLSDLGTLATAQTNLGIIHQRLSGGTTATRAYTITGLLTTSNVAVTCLSQTNASYVLTAVPTADTLTVVFNTDPGASTVLMAVGIK